MRAIKEVTQSQEAQPEAKSLFFGRRRISCKATYRILGEAGGKLFMSVRRIGPAPVAARPNQLLICLNRPGFEGYLSRSLHLWAKVAWRR